MIDNEILKYIGHRPRSIHILAILTILVRYLLSLMTVIIDASCFTDDLLMDNRC